MKKITSITLVILLLALNAFVFANLIFSPTNGLVMNGTLTWTEDTEAFVEENFGHIESDFEKTIAFRQWVIDNIKYDSYTPFLLQTIDVDKTIASGKGICFEQASVFTIFCRISGIKCYNVDGHAKSNFFTAHSWNRYCVDGQWYEIDITHDQNNSKFNEFGIKLISSLDAPDPAFNIYRTY